MPELSRIPGLVLSGTVFSNCLMVVQFLRAFGKVLGMDPGEVPTLGVLQEGLLNLGNSMGRVQDLLVRMLSSAVSDPGLPPGHKVTICSLTHTHSHSHTLTHIQTCFLPLPLSLSHMHTHTH